MATQNYIMHMFRRLQDNNFDLSILLSGDKGMGKSNTGIWFSMKYIELFGFVCPNCGAEFYKNVYSIKNKDSDTPEFVIPDYILNDRAKIQCPINERLDIKTGQKKHVSGCGYKFPWSQRKKIKWEAKKFIAFDAKSLVDLVFNAPPYSPILADEAFQILSGQNHNRAENKYLKEVLNNARPKRHMMFYCIPEAVWLDSKVREGFSSFWIRMIERGKAVLFEKDKGESKDKYHMKELEQIFGVVKYFTPMEKIKRNLKKHPCYFDMINIPAVSKPVYNDYEMYRNSVLLQRQVEELSLSNKDIAKMAVWNLLNNWERVKIAINKSRENRPTYNILQNEILVDPVTRRSLASEPTIRNWCNGVEKFIKSKGQDSSAFTGKIAENNEEVGNAENGGGIESGDKKESRTTAATEDPIKQTEEIQL